MLTIDLILIMGITQHFHTNALFDYSSVVQGIGPESRRLFIDDDGLGELVPLTVRNK